MNRLQRAFSLANAQHRPARVLFMPCGFPSPEASEAVMNTLIEEGADILELGVPFSDPIADGAVIQAASQQALKAGASLRKTLTLAANLRAKHPNTGLILFSYYNPLMAYGFKTLCQDAANAGIDGLLVVDVPYEEQNEIRPTIEAAGLSWIPLVSPATTLTRAQRLIQGCNGFVYVITVRGITGERKTLPPELTDRLDALRAITPLPLAAGFGISDYATAQHIGQHAQGIVVGSAAVHALQSGGLDGLRQFMRALCGKA
mgnify:FL=1